jgi:hypothetical protein
VDKLQRDKNISVSHITGIHAIKVHNSFVAKGDYWHWQASNYEKHIGGEGHKSAYDSAITS